MEPVFNVEVSNTDAVSLTTLSLQDLSHLLWIIYRSMCNNECAVPDWSGWVSVIAEKEITMKSAIGYLLSILHPITDYATVHKCMKTSMLVTAKLGQEYILITMDLAAAKIAYDIQWNKGQKFAKL